MPLIALFCCFFLSSIQAEQKPLKILHLTFHQGCVKEIAAIGKIFGHEVTTWWIPSLPPRFFDGTSQGNALYNIGHERAERIWNLHKETFEQFDAVITSDTAPLARIFLQNGFQKPLIVWICCRFDYSDQQSLDCDFPDPEFYQLFNQAYLQENVTIVAYTAFEHYYAEKKGVKTGNLIITPCAPEPSSPPLVSFIPPTICKEETFFLPPYLNETSFINLNEHCQTLGISSYLGRYNGPSDLKDFKGIIHLPYAWSNLALFENIALGIPYFIPSPSFLKTLIMQKNYWHTNPTCILHENQIALSEWYQPEREEIFIYFDSWEDLQEKIKTTDYPALREKIKSYAKHYQSIMLEKWSQIFM
ncbi:MAG: hypothetical protein KGJ02_07690 [Verrucomicrobiota bacterium]|nr:hypothetical protein [Verrucomicrobiota bacterium]